MSTSDKKSRSRPIPVQHEKPDSEGKRVPKDPDELEREERERKEGPTRQGDARNRVSSVNPIDTGDRGTTGPAGI